MQRQSNNILYKTLSNNSLDPLAKYEKMAAYLQNREIFIFDGFAGADPKYRVAVRVINEYASENLFMNNMLIRPTEKELASFKEDYTLIAVPGMPNTPFCGSR